MDFRLDLRISGEGWAQEWAQMSVLQGGRIDIFDNGFECCPS